MMFVNLKIDIYQLLCQFYLPSSIDICARKLILYLQYAIVPLKGVIRMQSFDPKKFASLMKKAIGNRTAKQFAAEAGLSEAYISRRLTGIYGTPPRKNTLTAIASAAQNDVTLRQLLHSCGYTDDTPAASRDASSGEIKIAKASILSCINDLGTSCQISAKEPLIPCDFEVRMDADPPLYWDFTCIPLQTVDISVEQFLQEKYLSLMYSRLQEYSKMSFVTSNKEAFFKCVSKKPVNLNVNISVILCSADTLEIVREEVLSTSVSSPLPEGKYSFNQKGE